LEEQPKTTMPATSADQTEDRTQQHHEAARQRLASVTIRFAGDSGDGIQLTGSQFTNTTALAGNDLATLPDFPAEIRAPTGTLPGVSGFQIQFSAEEVYTPGDQPDMLVAFNPAALRVHLPDLPPNGILLIDTSQFDAQHLKKAGYVNDPRKDGSLGKFRLLSVDLTEKTLLSLKDSPLGIREKTRCRNFFALGIAYWLFHRSTESTLHWIQDKFKKEPQVAEANTLALKGGYAYCEMTEVFHAVAYEVPPKPTTPGTYRNLSGNQALALGLVSASVKAKRPIVFGAYPITPASDILHELARYKNFGVVTFQAEDEIAAVCAAIGASYAGALGVTGTSGPGLALKSEAVGLAVMTELPLVVLGIQRGGPSTGLPTKTEQADLLMSLHGHHGEAPVCIIAPATSGECFNFALEACRLAVKYMTPVYLLSDGYLANGAEPWRIPDPDQLPEIQVSFAHDPASFQPYERDPKTLSRPWALPGTPGLEHRIGGLEKSEVKGNVSYDPANHDIMTRLRAEKVARIAQDIPPLEVEGNPDAELLVVGWGSTYGAIRSAIGRVNAGQKKVAHAQLRYLNPFPANTETVLRRYPRVLCPEMNLGQLSLLLRAKYLVDVQPYTKVQGQPFKAKEIEQAVVAALEGKPLPPPPKPTSVGTDAGG
jgi:2-oxoglutarate/2-oxoacid ferredoxin oxidoreductase subunit alpha